MTSWTSVDASSARREEQQSAGQNEHRALVLDPGMAGAVLDSRDQTPVVGGTESASQGACRRKHPRVPGPFDAQRVGPLETPVRLFDLSRGGCFINSTHEQRLGGTLMLKIDLPYEGSITVKAETLYRRDEFGFAVRFIEMSEATSVRLERALDALEQHGLPYDV